MVKSVKVYHYDAFSKEPNKGNPAGVVLHGDDLTEEEMQEIAFKVGFNETAFSMKSEIADFRIRYFTPGQEMNLCGHGTVAMMYALKAKGLLGDKTELNVETKAGVLPIKISIDDDEIFITMQQASPQFQEFNGSKEELANSIGLTQEDLDDHLPILYGNTGNWTLLIPIRKLDAFMKMKPNNQLFPTLLEEISTSSVHPFCLETYDPKAHMHGRHFSSPYSGTVEDAVTGTASGVMGAYYAQYIHCNFDKSINLIVEQGHEIEKDGRVQVRISQNKDHNDVEITGNAVCVKEFEVVLDK